MFQLLFGIGHGRFRLDLLDAVRTVGRLGNAQLAIDGFRVRATAGSQALVDVYLNASRPPGQPYGPGYAVTASLSVGASGIPDVEAVEQVRHVAHAVLAKVFPRDPASQAGPTAIVDARPNRAPDRLTNYWQGAALPGLPGTSASWTPLTDDLVQVDVLQSRLADPAADETKTTSVVPICIPHPRTNWFAALSAYQHARGLFDTMRGYGLLPETFFRFASLPLHIRYRAPIDPGPGRDGRTVNAQVDYDPPDHDMVGMGATSPPPLKPLQVRFALGDLRRSRSRREPLGLSTDERWSWHEYCHVLLAAATGALELPFSHSAGDALAAIMGDPDSALSVNQERRGLTFPWVYLHRCHDRSVFNGWSWSGRLHRQARFTTNSNRRHKGYESEQIMSTSLFRLYRALGGDTVSDRVVRKRAANYTAYLVMRAIDLLGPAALMPADTPGDFVLALIAADTGTLPVSSGPLAERVGGWAAKVVGWAFEAQGLDARRDPLDVFDAPGEPPEVDIYVDNGRPPARRLHAGPAGLEHGGAAVGVAREPEWNHGHRLDRHRGGPEPRVQPGHRGDGEHVEDHVADLFGESTEMGQGHVDAAHHAANAEYSGRRHDDVRLQRPADGDRTLPSSGGVDVCRRPVQHRSGHHAADRQPPDADRRPGGRR
jgi:hypothetical protein